jgi:hypothetical protein
MCRSAGRPASRLALTGGNTPRCTPADTHCGRHSCKVRMAQGWRHTPASPHRRASVEAGRGIRSQHRAHRPSVLSRTHYGRPAESAVAARRRVAAVVVPVDSSGASNPRTQARQRPQLQIEAGFESWQSLQAAFGNHARHNSFNASCAKMLRYRLGAPKGV